jgi:NAD(P)-dependent dehydrogenase (short-subunit alcohol dehydrogenase family)
MTAQDPKTGVAIVTGAASGMGLSCAAQLADQGWPLILCDLNADRLGAAAASLRSGERRVDTLAGDISHGGFCDRLIALLADRPIGALIHAAGLSPTMADGKRIFEVNYDATARLVEAVRPRMAQGACAVLIASSAGHMMNSPEIDAALDAITPGQESAAVFPQFVGNSGAAYSVSKRGVHRMIKNQAAPFGARKARIVSISPGLINTPMGRTEAKDSPQMTMMLEQTPLGRYGTSDEIASVAVFLCSPGASFVSGIDVLVDGGVMTALIP